MSRPTSARSKPAGLSRTAAKRQAHRESCLFRPEQWSGLYSVWIAPGAGSGLRGLSYADARRSLAAWRAERVRELIGCYRS